MYESQTIWISYARVRLCVPTFRMTSSRYVLNALDEILNKCTKLDWSDALSLSSAWLSHLSNMSASRFPVDRDTSHGLSFIRLVAVSASKSRLNGVRNWLLMNPSSLVYQASDRCRLRFDAEDTIEYSARNFRSVIDAADFVLMR
jgi:hypothetical protein